MAAQEQDFLLLALCFCLPIPRSFILPMIRQTILPGFCWFLTALSMPIVDKTTMAVSCSPPLRRNAQIAFGLRA
jgi:hypothetical protein